MSRQLHADANIGRSGAAGEAHIQRGVERASRLQLASFCLLAAGVVAYAVTYSSLSIATYRSGHSLFDLAAFEQSFWTAAHGHLFLNSLEVTRPDLTAQMSHFGRHFSPILFVLLPAYLLHEEPSTLLILQSLALAGAAVPLYVYARMRLKSPIVAAMIAIVYLANPALHDVNTVNEFHELAFVIPLIFFVFCAIERQRWVLYAVGVLGMLAVKEDVALTVCALGLYLTLFTPHRRQGALTIVAGAAWFAIVMAIVIPGFRGPNGPIPLLGYSYLGHGIIGIATGIVAKPRLWWHVATTAPKLRYVFWLLAPVSFVALLAPDILIVASPALAIILVSTSPMIYAQYAQYVAPVLAVIFVALVVGVERLTRAATSMGRWRLMQSSMMGLALFSIMGATAFAQVRLHKLPTEVVYQSAPNAYATVAIGIVDQIPQQASVVVDDHRWLAHAANRVSVDFLFDRSPQADYVLIDPASYPPVTNVHENVRDAAVNRIVASGNYLTFDCSQGFTLYIRRGAYARDGNSFGCTLKPAARSQTHSTFTRRAEE